MKICIHKKRIVITFIQTIRKPTEIMAKRGAKGGVNGSIIDVIFPITISVKKAVTTTTSFDSGRTRSC